MRTRLLLAAAAACSLALPGLASAQQWYGGARDGYRQAYGGGQYRDYGRTYQGYGRNDGGDYYGYGRRFQGYPEFRGAEAHIRSEIQRAVAEDMIEAWDARELMGQLREIQLDEQREFRFHGWNLPQDDRDRLRRRLDQLDRQVDEIRNEQ